ncbi:hypothetical protein BMETH_2734_0 [methanotrophic bacterial endosymbiont of Bathymodiolus sp.]|nr:hypothetical protein BMETH_2734_0 [methanotrophic bacterial endosymbiont of Bathymodiolus sp.]
MASDFLLVRHASIMAVHSASVNAMGSSHHTSLPALAAFITYSLCMEGGKTM